MADVIHVPCTACGGPRHHLGVGVCWECMTPEQRERFGQQDARATQAIIHHGERGTRDP